jgi:NAD(P)-dependent dehydrogenase (short-subunit alcohol dehydrogenase family)
MIAATLLVIVGSPGRGCLVTGGTGAVGTELVAQLVGRGHRVAFTSRNPAAGRALEEEMAERHGAGLATSWPLDLRFARPTAYAQLVEAIEQQLAAPLALVINSAAVCEAGRDVRTFARALRVNAAAPMAMCEAVLPRMRRRGFGRIVNVSSGDGERPYLHSSVCAQLDNCGSARELGTQAVATLRHFDGEMEYAHGPTPAYAWSKALLNRATQLAALGLEQAGGVSLCAACPGDVLTRMMSDGVDPAETRTPAEAASSLLLAAFLDDEEGGVRGAAGGPRPRAYNGAFLRDGIPIPF